MRGFDECDFGEFENLTAEELAPHKEFSEWLAGGPDAKPLNGESNQEFSTRVCDAFIKTVDGLIKTGTTSCAIFTHGGVIMSILSAFGLPELPMTEWLCPSACGYTVRITPSLWSKTRKMEVINDIPASPLTESQEELLWDYYSDIPEDEPLGEARAKYLTKRLNIIGVCAVLEAVMLITSSILNFILQSLIRSNNDLIKGGRIFSAVHFYNKAVSF